MAKTAYISPPLGVLAVTMIRDGNPRVDITLDLGIPNFTVFSLKMPLVEDTPGTMNELIADAVNALCDEVSSFMMAAEYDEEVIVQMYATIFSCFKSMTKKNNTDKNTPIGQDDHVQIFENTFALPMSFINETQKRVVTAKAIQRPPKMRHLELTYVKPPKPNAIDAAKVIRQYRTRSLKQQSRPLYIIVYDQMGRPTGTVSVGPNFKNDLLRATKKKKGAIDFSPPISFPNEMQMKSSPINGIPQAISLEGFTYQPIAVAGVDMALYEGPQSWLVKFPDGRADVFPASASRPSIRKLRALNFPVPRNRWRWTYLREGDEDVE
jgi:hypothetical protein